MGWAPEKVETQASGQASGTLLPTPPKANNKLVLVPRWRIELERGAVGSASNVQSTRSK